MPLTRYLDGGAHILAADDSLIRFAMTDGQRVIGIDVPIPVLRQTFGQSSGQSSGQTSDTAAESAPLDLFARNQAAIEAAASKAYDTIPTPNDLLDLGPEDFAARPAPVHL